MQYQPAQIADQLRQDDALQGLTSQQQLFVTHVFSGMSYADAFRAAGYGSGLNPANVRYKAQELAHQPIIQSKLRELRERRDDASTLAPLVTREWITQGIANLALTGDRDSVKLAAYIALGKTVGIDLFRETHVTETRQRTIEEIDAELRARLKDLQPVIEGSSRPTPAADVPGDRRRKPKA